MNHSNYFIMSSEKLVIVNHPKNSWLFDNIKNKRLMVISTDEGFMEAYAVCNTEKLPTDKGLYFKSCLQVNNSEYVHYVASLDHAIEYYNYHQ